MRFRPSDIIPLLGLALGCQPQPATDAGVASQRWDAHIAAFASYEVLVLNPEEAQDRVVIERGLERLLPQKVSSSYRWLPTNPARGRRGYASLARQSDAIETRRRLRSCLNHAQTPSDTVQTQVLLVQVRVSPEGTVLHVAVRASTVNNTDVLSCLMETVVSWHLGEAQGEETFDVPLVLMPSSYGR